MHLPGGPREHLPLRADKTLMDAANEPPAQPEAAPDVADATGDRPVYAFGLAITGLAGLLASADAPAEGPLRAVALRVVGEEEIDRRWQAADAVRIVDRSWPDGRLVLAVDEDRAVGYRVDAPEFGVHLVSADGTEVLLPKPEGPPWFAQRLLFSQSLPIAATLQGLGLFHASAVRIDGRVVAVSAASGTGKSSTAAHLIAHGAEFFTDDVLALEVIDGEIVAFAGPQIAGLVEHEALAIDPARRERLGEYLGMSDKQLRRPALAQTSLPLGALYLLERDPDVEAVTIDALDTSGTAMLLASAFIPHLSTDARLIGHLELCGTMAGAGQIFRVRAPLRGTAAAVSLVLMDHARSRSHGH